MYHITKTTGTDGKNRWVLLEHLPTILSPKILILVFLYAMAFTLLVLGFRILHFDRSLSDTAASITSTENYSQSALLYQEESAEQIQEGIAAQVIRLHIVANSDSDEDQALKLRVRDAVIQGLQSSLSSVDSVKDAKSVILAQIPTVEKIASETMKREGYDYSVKVTLGTKYFPVKVYGDLSFPAGNYEALCLQIGAAKGHNWWCVLFPSLCFVDETYAVVPEESKEKLRKSLSEEEYDSLQIHSAIFDWAKENTKKK